VARFSQQLQEGASVKGCSMNSSGMSAGGAQIQPVSRIEVLGDMPRLGSFVFFPMSLFVIGCSAPIHFSSRQALV
jgi:hypothetical protein